MRVFILRECLHKVRSLPAHVSQAGEDAKGALVLHLLELRVDEDEGARATDARRAVHHHGRVLLLLGRELLLVAAVEAHFADECQHGQRRCWHAVVGPVRVVIVSDQPLARSL